MKYWIVPRADDANSLTIIGASFVPPNAIMEAPKDPLTGELEDIGWLVIQDQAQGDGSTKKVAVIDAQAKKDLKKQQKDAEKDREKKDKDLKDMQAEVIHFLEDFDKSSLASLSDVQDAIEQIVKALKVINRIS